MARQDVALNTPAPLADADIGASLESKQTKALGQYLFWVLKSHQAELANPDKIRFGGPTPNRLFNEYANEAEWKQKLGENWLADMQKEIPLLAELKLNSTQSFGVAATPPALLKHYQAFYNYIAPAFAEGKFSRTLLDQGMGAWAAETMRLISLHLKYILNTPELIKNATTEFNQAYETSLTSQEALYFIASTFHLAFASEAYTTFQTAIHHEDLRIYFYRFLTWMLPDTKSYLEQALPESYVADSYGLVNYTQHLFANINSLEASQLRAYGFSFLENPEQPAINNLVKRTAEALSLHEDPEQVRIIDRETQLFTRAEFLEFCATPEMKDCAIAQVKMLDNHRDLISPDSYAKVVAGLIISHLGDVKTQNDILAVVPKSDRLKVYKAILKLAETAPVDENLRAFETQAMKSLVGLYLGYKNAINANMEFTALDPHQKAERNIAAAYEILALLESLQTYNESAASQIDKDSAYKAVMNVVMHLRAEAEIRGKRGAQLGRQSSEFAKLLNFSIPGVEPVAVVKGQKTLDFPAGFDLTAFNSIKAKHAAENTWFKRFSKKLNNWAAQNPATITAVVLGAAFMALGGTAVTFALITVGSVAIPFIGSVAAASLLIPGAAAAAVGLLIAITAITANAIRNTAEAKIKNKLGGLNITEGNSMSSAGVSVPMTPPNTLRVTGVRGVSGVPVASPDAAGSTSPASAAKRDELLHKTGAFDSTSTAPETAASQEGSKSEIPVKAPKAGP